MITREEFLAKQPTGFPVYEEVTVPELGKVWVKKMRAGERDRFEVGNAEAERADFRARIVAHTVIDERGAMVFTPDDIPTLSLFDADVLDPIVMAALRVNRFSEKEQDELRKNSNGQAPNS